jgi:integrase/recombinase XerD
MNDVPLTVVATPITPAIRVQAETDNQLIELWLHGRSRHTQIAYRRDAERMVTWADKSLHEILLVDLQAFASSLEAQLQPASVRRVLAAVKSLFAFAHRLGYLPFDTARPLRLPAAKDTLAERILDERELHQILAVDRHPRNRVMLRLLYAAGLRVSEVCSLCWRDLSQRENGGQLSIFGKGGKTRYVLVPKSVWDQLVAFKADGRDEQPVFRSRKGNHLSPTQVWRIVVRASERAGITRRVSTHWLRHAHASHALDRGAPIHLVQATLGHSSLATTGRYLHARPSDSSANYLRL